MHMNRRGAGRVHSSRRLATGCIEVIKLIERALPMRRFERASAAEPSGRLNPRLNRAGEPHGKPSRAARDHPGLHDRVLDMASDTVEAG